ncbi:hypothetical protein ACFLVW_04665 [Chloroflexota bacterium]
MPDRGNNKQGIQYETHVLQRPGYVFRITTQGKSRNMRIAEGDYSIITVYRNLYNKPRTTVLHEMIAYGEVRLATRYIT